MRTRKYLLPWKNSLSPVRACKKNILSRQSKSFPARLALASDLNLHHIKVATDCLEVANNLDAIEADRGLCVSARSGRNNLKRFKREGVTKKLIC
jgi:hypothetical protein